MEGAIQDLGKNGEKANVTQLYFSPPRQNILLDGNSYNLQFNMCNLQPHMLYYGRQDQKGRFFFEKGDQPILAERRNEGNILYTTRNNLKSNKILGEHPLTCEHCGGFEYTLSLL